MSVSSANFHKEIVEKLNLPPFNKGFSLVYIKFNKI